MEKMEPFSFATLGPVGKTCGLGPERHYYLTNPATQPPDHIDFIFKHVTTL